MLARLPITSSLVPYPGCCEWCHHEQVTQVSVVLAHFSSSGCVPASSGTRGTPLYLHNTQMCPFSPTPPLRPWLLALLSPITNIPMSVPINLCVCFNVCTSVPYCLDYCQFGVYFKVSPDGAINFSFPFSREPRQFKIFCDPIEILGWSEIFL